MRSIGTAALPVMTEKMNSEEDLMITEHSEGSNLIKSPNQVGQIMINSHGQPKAIRGNVQMQYNSQEFVKVIDTNNVMYKR
jgi:hypothetical protein